jgi:regulator of PEP synthase PpsR (kinase-PPPase family)
MAERALCDIVADSGALMLDVFAPFIGPLEDELGAKRSGAVNRSHGMVDFDEVRSADQCDQLRAFPRRRPGCGLRARRT